jgi:hypothetical protein
MLCLTWSHKPADRPALRKGEQVAERLRIRYGLAAHMNLYVPKFKSANEGDVFCRAAIGDTIASDVTSLPGLQRDGLFRVQARRYGQGSLLRVIALARPTA